MTDPIADILGDYRAFFAGQKDRLRARGIDISPYPLSHLAYRVHEYDQYLQVRGLLERHAMANVENVWNGRPISKILLREPLQMEPQVTVDLIELLPPPHQRTYKMGGLHPREVLPVLAPHGGRAPARIVVRPLRPRRRLGPDGRPHRDEGH